jgi:hypothetical protein
VRELHARQGKSGGRVLTNRQRPTSWTALKAIGWALTMRAEPSPQASQPERPSQAKMQLTRPDPARAGIVSDGVASARTAGSAPHSQSEFVINMQRLIGRPPCPGQIVTQRCRLRHALRVGVVHAGNARARVQRGSALQAGGRRSAVSSRSLRARESCPGSAWRSRHLARGMDILLAGTAGALNRPGPHYVLLRGW